MCVCASAVCKLWCAILGSATQTNQPWACVGAGQVNLYQISATAAPLFSCSSFSARRQRILVLSSGWVSPCTSVLRTLCICVQAWAHAYLTLCWRWRRRWRGVCTCQSVRMSASTVAKSLNDFQHPSPLPVWRWSRIHHGDRASYHWG